MIYINRGFLFAVIALCSFSTLAEDAYIYFAHYPGTPKSERHSYTIRAGGESQGMYGVYYPGVAHLSEDVADVDLETSCPPDYVAVHWKANLHQSYQDFFVTRDDKPSVKARFRWYKPYADLPYITVFANPGHILTFYQNWSEGRVDCSEQDTLLYVD
ncbi:hypothetical protein [Endozoicomonas sp. 2B-B]